MKIKEPEKQKPKLYYFKGFEPGDIFKYQDTYFMKTSQIEILNGPYINAVQISSGRLVSFIS